MVKSALRIAAMNDAAARLRLTVGTALADARARHPTLQVAQSDPAADQRLLDAVADWCDRYTPLVGIDAPSGVMLDVTGCTHLFGGETALCRDIVTRLAAQGLRARVAVASTPGCAWGVARYGFWSTMPVIPGEPEGRGPESITPVGEYGFRARGRAPAPRNDENQHLFIVPPGAMRDALAPLPLAALRLDPETVAALADVGLDRIADVLDLPRSVLAARFDAAFLRRLDQALGREDEPITPRRPAPSFMAEQHFAEPIARERDVLGTIARLSIRLGYAMETRGEGARLLEAALFRTDGKVHRIAVGTGAPLREAERITRLFKDRLATVGEACDPGFGYDLVRLSAPVTERCDPVQAGLAASHPAADQAAELGHLIDRLGARFGLRRVTRLAPQDTHIPEFAVAAVPARPHSSSPTQPSRMFPTWRHSIEAERGNTRVRLGEQNRPQGGGGGACVHCRWPPPPCCAWFPSPVSRGRMSRHTRAGAAGAPVRAPRTHRGDRRSARRSAGALPLAADAARGRGRRRTRAHCARMVARCGGRRAHP